MLDDPSNVDDLHVPGRPALAGLDPNVDASHLADRHSAGSGSHTDRADHIDLRVAKVLRRRDGARPACPSPLDRSLSCSESIPRDIS